MSNRFTDNVTPLNATVLNKFEGDLGASLGVSGGSIQLKNTDGSALSTISLPKASQTISGSAKIWVSGATLYISTN